ncbi:hypothetical protein KIL84_006087 [Mauremys mutica]|uniref:Uncharacterized protein n=1 Tax=Mauremys mutica TaxID=74926 RepID=A0A9D3XHH4_9SAUR|nr:hypothetical protein KIL84_006087 [Mauremys mutica]
MPFPPQRVHGNWAELLPKQLEFLQDLPAHTFEENSFSYAAKSCLEPESCEPGPFTVTCTRNITVRVNIACCNTDGCNAGAIAGNETLTRAATGCGSPGACGMRVGVKKYAQGVVDVLSRAECDPAPWAGGDL